MKTIKEVLTGRDDMSEQEAEALIAEATEQFHRYLQQGDLQSAYNICEEYFGLEPDYVTQLI